MTPTHLHLVLNHIPVIGFLAALLFLGWGLLRRHDQVVRAALGAVVVIAIFTIPTYLTGEPAEEAVEGLAGISEPIIESHEDAALVALIAMIVTGIAAAITLLVATLRQPYRPQLGYLTAVVGIIAFALIARAANLGGQIRHSEIRGGTAVSQPAETGSESHGENDD